jgi:hypothetical protein
MIETGIINFNEIIGIHTLLYGETETKKTYFTALFVKFLIRDYNVHPSEISILDFAPQLAIFKGKKVGGRIEDFYKESLKCKYYPRESKIIASRINAQNKKDLYNNICQNHLIISKAMVSYEKDPTRFLIINDLSIYLHLGNKQRILNIIDNSTTFFGNAYYGFSIGNEISSLLSLKERYRVKYLISRISNSISSTQ